ncbi:MAG TPA: hypothetical protein VK203_24295 [Nostocaceae cyanobacterium]|nr:hypothetical protein [Nostocaceae cyanobacterium]
MQIPIILLKNYAHKVITNNNYSGNGEWATGKNNQATITNYQYRQIIFSLPSTLAT